MYKNKFIAIIFISKTEESNKLYITKLCLDPKLVKLLFVFKIYVRHFVVINLTVRAVPVNGM